MDETRRVRRSLLVLLFALLLIYVIFFDVQEESIQWLWTSLATGRVVQQQPVSSLRQSQIQAQQTTISTNVPITQPTPNNTTSPTNSQGVLPQSQSSPPADVESSLLVWQSQSDVRQTVSPSSLPSNSADPMVSNSPVPNQTWVLPSIIQDFDGKTFFSTDYLFWRTPASPQGSWVSTPQSQQQSEQTQPPSSTVVSSTQDFSSTLASSDIIPIANTWQRRGTLDIIDKLNLEDDVQYTLKDINNTHYIYLGKFDESLQEIVTFLWWSLVDITDNITIQNNQLIGNKVTKITVPSYKNNLKELMIITFQNGDSRFLQIDKDYYNTLENKIYIKQLFEEHY